MSVYKREKGEADINKSEPPPKKLKINEDKISSSVQRLFNMINQNIDKIDVEINAIDIMNDTDKDYGTLKLTKYILEQNKTFLQNHSDNINIKCVVFDKCLTQILNDNNGYIILFRNKFNSNFTIYDSKLLKTATLSCKINPFNIQLLVYDIWNYFTVSTRNMNCYIPKLINRPEMITKFKMELMSKNARKYYFLW